MNSGPQDSRTKVHFIIAMAVCLIVGNAADDAVIGTLGYWGAFGVRLIAGVAAGGATYWLLNTFRAPRPH